MSAPQPSNVVVSMPYAASPGQNKAKRPQACVTCRRQKMKCKFSVPGNTTCDRCRASNLECRFEVRANDKQWTATVEDRLRRLEEGFNQLLDALRAQNAQQLGRIERLSSPDTALSRNFVVNGAESTTTINTSLSSAGAGSSSPPSQGAVVAGVKRAAPDDEARAADEAAARRTRRKYQHYELVEVSASSAAELVEYFSTRLAKYLPILVFKYMPQFTAAGLRERSPLLFLSILTIGSLYHPEYQGSHTYFRQHFEAIAGMLPKDLNEHRENSLQESVDLVVGLSVAGAWLGGELGFKMSLKASEIAGTVFPEAIQAHQQDIPKRDLISAIGLMTYIIEQRLRIIHVRAIEPSQVVHGKRRDVFLAEFLAAMMRHRKGRHDTDVAELKITANVELCAIILMLQVDLYSQIKCDIIEHWNYQLDKWLTEWMSKLTVSLLPSSWKPVLLTFHFAKMFVNSLAGSEVKPGAKTYCPPRPGSQMTDTDRARFMATAEESAMTILDMLIRDKDMDRLISVGPVFYPTIFITAGAWLLKLVTTAPAMNLAIDSAQVLQRISQAHAVLAEAIALPVLPCFQAIRGLGSGLSRVEAKLAAATAASTGSSSPDQPTDAYEVPMAWLHDAYNTDIVNPNLWSFTPFNEAVPATNLTMSSTTNNNIVQPDYLIDALTYSLLDSIGERPLL
ncbi:hypothetical protein TRVA0_010S02322 [Trichomonascus vanleenenianus]|uniref:Zn(II)2Cys6 transcription factor domain-containing protein n=1 Tax=Trichomonascus vanleenenianus TaxID=2268995 RepID=UPI003EC9888F